MPKSTPKSKGMSFTHSPRILGGNVHNDPLFQFYYNDALISSKCGIGPLGHLHDLGVHPGGWA